jgi:hypothetical protein
MKPPKLIRGMRFFKAREPKQFSFEARYYNEDKEKFENRVHEIKTEVEAEKLLTIEQKAELNSIRSGAFRRNQMQKQGKANSMRFLIILGMLIILMAVTAYGFLKMDF